MASWWNFSQGDSELIIEAADDGYVSLDVTNGPFKADRKQAEKVRRAYGAAISAMPEATS